MALNMLQRSRINPKMSAYTQLFGAFDYNQTPIAPLGTKAFVYEKIGQRRSHTCARSVVSRVLATSMITNTWNLLPVWVSKPQL